VTGGIQGSVVDSRAEPFVKNRLAGATASTSPLVIAPRRRDQPQTEEHLPSSSCLGRCRGIPVLTKRDLVDDEWLGLVDEVATAARQQSAWQAPIAVRALTGEGWRI